MFRATSSVLMSGATEPATKGEGWVRRGLLTIEDAGAGAGAGGGAGDGKPPAGEGDKGAGDGKPPAGTGAPSWDTLKAHIPAEYQKEKLWETVPDFPTLAKNYVESQRYIGQAIKIPGKDAKPEEIAKFNEKLDKVEGVFRSPGKDAKQEDWDKFFTKLGRPETAEGYQPSLPALPDGIPWDPGMLQGWGKIAHSAGLNPGQLQKLINGHAEMVWQVSKSMQKNRTETKKALETELGQGWENEMMYADTAIYQLGGEETFKYLKQTISSIPTKQAVPLLKMMIKAGKLLAEEDKIDVTAIRDGNTNIQAKIDAMLKGDKKTPYWNQRDPGHKAAVEQMGKWQAALNPGKQGEAT